MIGYDSKTSILGRPGLEEECMLSNSGDVEVGGFGAHRIDQHVVVQLKDVPLLGLPEKKIRIEFSAQLFQESPTPPNLPIMRGFLFIMV